MGNTLPRFGSGSGQDNTFRSAIRNYVYNVFDGDLVYIPEADFTILEIDGVSSDMTITLDDRESYLGDTIRMYFTNPYAGTHNITINGSNLTFSITSTTVLDVTYDGYFFYFTTTSSSGGSFTTPYMDFNTQEAFDINLLLSIDWNGRSLIDENGSNAVSWSNGAKYASDDNNLVSVDWGDRQLNDEAGKLAMEWSVANRYLNDVNGAGSVDYNQRLLFNTGGIRTFEWQNMLLNDVSAHTSINWGTRTGYDVAQLLSIDWGSRHLINGSNLVLMDWSGSNLSVPNANLSVTNNVTAGSITSIGLLQLAAGTTSFAPLNIPSGVLASSLTNGNIEFNGTHLYATIGGARIQLDNLPNTVNIVGTIDTYAVTNGANIVGDSIYFQSASATEPGFVNTSSQMFQGIKTFNSSVIAEAGVQIIGNITYGTGGAFATLTPSLTGWNMNRNEADANTLLILQNLNASATGDLLDFKNSIGTVLASVNSTGQITTINGVSSPYFYNGSVSSGAIHSAGTGLVLSRTVADANAVATIQNASTTATGNLLNLSNSSNTVVASISLAGAIVGTSLNVGSTGTITGYSIQATHTLQSPVLQGNLSTTYGQLVFPANTTTPTNINRNIADANAVLVVQNLNSGSTGDILDLSNSAGSNMFKVNYQGNVTATGYIATSGTVYSTTLEGQNIQNGASQTVIQLQNLYLYDTSGVVSADWGNRQLFDSNHVLSINYSTTRSLYSAGGIQILDWNTNALKNTAGHLVMDWGSLELFDNTSVQSMNWGTRVLCDDNGVVAIGWSIYNRVLYDASSNESVAYQDRILYDGVGVTSIDWTNRFFNDELGNNILNWANSNNSGAATFYVPVQTAGFISTVLNLDSSTPTYTPGFADYTMACDTTGGSIIILFNNPVNALVGQVFNICKIDPSINTVTITNSAGLFIGDSSAVNTLTLIKYDNVQIQYIGSNNFIVIS